jgi:hypothetical protein
MLFFLFSQNKLGEATILAPPVPDSLATNSTEPHAEAACNAVVQVHKYMFFNGPKYPKFIILRLGCV